MNICSTRAALFVFNIILLSTVPAFSQSKTCDLQLEVILNPKPDDVIEIPITDAVARYYDGMASKLVYAQTKKGMPFFAKLSEGNIEISVTKSGHKTTTKTLAIDCGLADATGVISDIIFLWKGNSAEFEEMSGGQISGGRLIRKPRPVFPKDGRGASGVVEVRITVDEKGDVVDARAIKGHRIFVQAAINAAMQIKFTPKFVQGRAVSFEKTVSYSFSSY